MRQKPQAVPLGFNILDPFGIDTPAEMRGKPLFKES